MNKYGWIIFSAVVLILLGSLIFWTRVTNPPLDVSSIDNNSVVAASDDNGNIADHTRGSDKNKILFIEYADYQCPGCGEAYDKVNTLAEEYGNDVTFIYRNFPLTSIHPNAKAAAGSAEAAGMQGKFWEMHDKIFAGQSDWSNLDASQRTTFFSRYAEALKLDVAKFEADAASKAVAKKLTFDIALGKSAEVSATPTFFLNGRKLEGTAWKVIEPQLQQAGAR